MRTGTPGRARPSSSAVRASPSTGARRPCPPHSGQRQPGAGVAHQAHSGGARARGGGAVRGRRRTGPAYGSGRRPAGSRSRPAASARARGRRWTASRSRVRASLGSRAERAPGVALEVAVGVAGEADRDPLAYDVARGDDLGGPAGADEVLRLDAARVRREQGRAPGLLGAHEQHLAGMGVRRPRLVVEVVAVVPDRHQAEVVHRRERGGAGADDDAHRPAADREERAVALGRARVGREHDVAALAEPRGERGVEPVDVAVVGDADQRARPRRGGGDDGLGQQVGPVVAGDDRPDSAGRVPGREPSRSAAPPG